MAERPSNPGGAGVPPGGTTFDVERILRILPHRAPFLLIDRVIELVPRERARAYKAVTYNEPFFPGHFPGHPIMPGVLIVEAMAQLTGVLAYASEPFDTSQKVMYFLGIDKAKFRHPIVPGDRIEIAIEVLQRRSNIWKTKGTATVDEKVCAEAEILAAITDRNEFPAR